MGVCLTMLVGFMVGCGESGPPASVPTEPTVEFEPKPPDEPQRLVGFFSAGRIALPAALGSMALGMAEADARAELERLRDPRFKNPDEQTIGTYRIVGGTLRGWDVVGLTLIFETQTSTLDQIDLSLPEGQALSALVQAYGEHTAEKTDAQGGKVFVWKDTEAQLQLELSEATEGRSICKLRTLLE